MTDGSGVIATIVSAVIGALTLGGCSGAPEEKPRATSTPVPASIVATATVIAAAPTPAQASAAGDASSPDSAATPIARRGTPSPEEMWAFVEGELATEAEDADFAIDAVASSFYGPVPNTVYFLARALNGTPPYTFTWTSTDGSPTVEGDRFVRTYENVGSWDVFVVGRDASGASARIQLGMKMVSPEEYVAAMHLDPKLLENLRTPATPVVTPLP